MLERYRVTASAKRPRFASAYLSDCLVPKADNVKAIEKVHGLTDAESDCSKESLPHVADDEANAGSALLAEPVEESIEGRRGSITSYPEKPPRATVELVDERQIFMPSSIERRHTRARRLCLLS